MLGVAHDGPLGVGDAAAAGPGELVTAACDQVHVLTTSSSSDGYDFVDEDKRWFAELARPGLDPADAPNVVATICGQESVGAVKAPIGVECGTTPGCVQSGYAPTASDCVQVPVHFYPGKIVVPCGASTKHTVNGVVQRESRLRWTTARVKVL
jgi:hypothetical protein